MSKNKSVWVHPICQDVPERNVWVMISRAEPPNSSPVFTLRVFSEPPSQALIETQRELIGPDLVNLELFEVAVDVFDVCEYDTLDS